MKAASPPSERPSSTPPWRFTHVLLVALVVMGVIMWAGRILQSPAPVGALVGKPLPALQVAGWVQGEPPELQGKVVVIEAWATWCLPCRRAAPHLVELQQKYAGREDVVFIGLTSENASLLPAIEKYLQELGITWPNGYGATSTLVELQGEVIPQVWVVDREGIITWNDHPEAGLEQAIEATLRQ